MSNNRALTAMAACVLFATVFPGRESLAQGMDRFVFANPNAISVTIAPFSFAQELGYFEAEKVDLQIMTLVGAGVIIPQLLNGGIDSTLIAPESLILSRATGGANFDFKFVYNYARNALYELVVLESSDIKSVADLAGKKVGVGGMSWGNVPGTKAVISGARVDINSVEFISVGDGAPALEALRKGQIDVLNLYDTRHVQFEQAGVKLRRLELPQRYIQAASLTMPFTNTLIKERPGLVGRFGRAVTKGIVACSAAIQNCVRAYWVRYPDKRPTKDQEAAAMEQAKGLLGIRLRSMVAFAADKPRLFGEFSDADFVGSLDALSSAGLIKDAGSISVASLYTNSFVPKFNDFDVDLVEREARGYAPR